MEVTSQINEKLVAPNNMTQVVIANFQKIRENQFLMVKYYMKLQDIVDG